MSARDSFQIDGGRSVARLSYGALQNWIANYEALVAAGCANGTDLLFLAELRREIEAR